MTTTRYRGRRAAAIENAELRVTVLVEGGHIAEIFDKRAGVNPLWTPPWPTIEPSAFRAGGDAMYGGGSDAQLLAGIAGHNLCLDLFGPPSEQEAKAGFTPHGEAAVAPYDVAASRDSLVMRAHFPLAGLEFERRIELRDRVVAFRETINNVGSEDRAIGWTQHVTLGPPFLERGATEFHSSATQSKVFESAFGADDYLRAGAEFDWPFAPRLDGTSADLRTFTDAERSSAYTAHLMNGSALAFFTAFSPSFQLALSYVWKSADFPWMGIWEENHSRRQAPWNGHTLTRGMEFGVSPMPETREAMLQRGTLFDVPTFRRIVPRETIVAEYLAVLRPARAIPETVPHSI